VEKMNLCELFLLPQCRINMVDRLVIQYNKSGGDMHTELNNI
jgi:hypothetical protein